MGGVRESRLLRFCRWARWRGRLAQDVIRERFSLLEAGVQVRVRTLRREERRWRATASASAMTGLLLELVTENISCAVVWVKSQGEASTSRVAAMEGQT